MMWSVGTYSSTTLSINQMTERLKKEDTFTLST